MTLRQWYCRGPHDNEYIFTPGACDADTALAIAQATFGRTIGSVVDEGTFEQQSLAECLAAQLTAQADADARQADPVLTAACAMKMHSLCQDTEANCCECACHTGSK